MSGFSARSVYVHCLAALPAALWVAGCGPIMVRHPQPIAQLRILDKDSIDATEFPDIKCYFSARYPNGTPNSDLQRHHVQVEEGPTQFGEKIAAARITRASVANPNDIPPARLFIVCDLRTELHRDAMRAAVANFVENWRPAPDLFALVAPDIGRKSATAVATNLKADMVVDLTNESGEIKRGLARLEHYSSVRSPLYDCLALVLNKTRQSSESDSGRTAIVVFSGGELLGTGKDVEEAQAVVDQLSSRGIPVVVSAYDLGGRDQQPRLETLRSLATSTDGELVAAGSSSQTNPLVICVGEALDHFYRLDFKSGQMNPSLTTATFTLELNTEESGRPADKAEFDTSPMAVERELVRRINMELGPLVNKARRLHGEANALLDDLERDNDAAKDVLCRGRPRVAETHTGAAWSARWDEAMRLIGQLGRLGVSKTTEGYLARLIKNTVPMQQRQELDRLKEEAQEWDTQRGGPLKQRAAQLREDAAVLSKVDRLGELIDSDESALAQFVSKMGDYWHCWTDGEIRRRFYTVFTEASAHRGRSAESAIRLLESARLLPSGYSFEHTAQSHHYLAERYAATGSHESAARMCEQANVRGDASPELFEMWAKSLIQLGVGAQAPRRLADATAKAEKLPKTDTKWIAKTAELLIEVGDAYHEIRDDNQAAAMYAQAGGKEQAPARARAKAWIRAGRLEKDRSDLAKAVDAHKEAYAVLTNIPDHDWAEHADVLYELMCWMDEQLPESLEDEVNPAQRDYLDLIVDLSDRILPEGRLPTEERAEAYRITGRALLRLGDRVRGTRYLKIADELFGRASASAAGAGASSRTEQTGVSQ